MTLVISNHRDIKGHSESPGNLAHLRWIPIKLTKIGRGSNRMTVGKTHRITELWGSVPADLTDIRRLDLGFDWVNQKAN